MGHIKTLGYTLATITGIGTACVASSVAQTRMFVVRKHTVPVLPKDSKPLKVIHISDLHFTSYRWLESRFIKNISQLEPDFVVATGDFMGGKSAWPALAEVLKPLLKIPGAFVFGSNDYYAPRPRNWLKYFNKTGASKGSKQVPHILPWTELEKTLQAAGWVNINNKHTEIEINEQVKIELVGVDDPHIHRDRFPKLASRKPLLEDGKLNLRFGLAHAPYRRVINRMAKENCDIVFAGHTHGGQICVPFYGALVTNCDLPRKYASGFFLWHSDSDDFTLVNVSAGVGTSPYAPVRFACLPEVSLLTLVPKEESPE